MAFTARTETYFNAASLTSPFDATVARPSGTAEGDILFAIICWYATVTIDAEPTGWTKLGDYTANTDRYALYSKIAGSSEPSSYTWSFTGSTKVRIVCSCYTAGDFRPVNPINVVSNTAYRTSDAVIRAASMSVSRPNSPMVFWASLYSTATRSFTPPTAPASWTEDDDTWHTDPDFANEVCSLIWTGSGATGNMDATASASTTTKHAFAVALFPKFTNASAVFSGAGSLAANGRRTRTASATLAGAGSLHVNATVIPSGNIVYASATLSGAGSLAANARRITRASATLSGTGSLAANARRIRRASGTLSGSGGLAANARRIRRASATLSGTGTLAANSRRTTSATARLMGTGSLWAQAVVIGAVTLASATFVGKGYLAAQLTVFLVSPTLLAAQKKPAATPYIEALVNDLERGLKRLSWQLIYQGSEPDNHHGIAFDGEGSMYRIRAGAGSKLYYQKVTSPGPSSDYSQWTEIASDCAGPCAIAARAGKVYIFYKKTDNTLRKYYSHNYGQSWTNAELAAYADVTHLAAAWWGTTTTVVCFALKAGTPVKLNGMVLDTYDQGTEQNEWYDGTRVLLEAYGLGATFNKFWPGIELVLAGKQSDSPYNHHDLFTSLFDDTHSFTSLQSIIMSPHGEGTTYEHPDCHLPDRPTPYESTRVTAVEKYTGTTAYTRPITTHLVKGTYWTDNTFVEPRPLLNITASFGLRLATTAGHWWLSSPSRIYRAERGVGRPLILTTQANQGRIIGLAQSVVSEPQPWSLKLTLDNAKGNYNSPGQGAMALIRPGAELLLKLGYRTPKGNEAAPAGTYWIDAWEYTHQPARSLFTIYAIDGWTLMQRWTARYQMRWNKDATNPASVWVILYQLLARVGIRLTNEPANPQSTAILNLKPDFTIDAGTRGTTALNRLLTMVPDALIIEGQTARTKEPLPDEQPCYAYGTDHPILDATYHRRTTTSRSRALGRATDGSRIVQEAIDWTLLSLAIDTLDQQYDPNLTTATRAQERADALLRKHALRTTGAQITVPVNCAQKLSDVVTITDARCGVPGQKRRILALNTTYDTRTRRYDHAITLGAA